MPVEDGLVISVILHVQALSCPMSLYTHQNAGIDPLQGERVAASGLVDIVRIHAHHF